MAATEHVGRVELGGEWVGQWAGWPGEGSGLGIQPLSYMQGLIPGPHGPDSGHTVALKLHLLFRRCRFKKLTGEPPQALHAALDLAQACWLAYASAT